MSEMTDYQTWMKQSTDTGSLYLSVTPKFYTKV